MVIDLELEFIENYSFSLGFCFSVIVQGSNVLWYNTSSTTQEQDRLVLFLARDHSDTF